MEDGKYGSFDKATQTWNGMIGELQSQKVDSMSPYICNRTGAANASREHRDDAIENKQTKLSLQADLVVADITITYEREQVLLSYSTSLSSACFIHNVCFVNI